MNTIDNKNKGLQFDLYYDCNIHNICTYTSKFATNFVCNKKIELNSSTGLFRLNSTESVLLTNSVSSLFANWLRNHLYRAQNIYKHTANVSNTE